MEIVNYKPTPADLRHERRMSRVLAQYDQETHKMTKSRLWTKYSDMHASRSKGYVKYMEQQKGLIRNEKSTEP